MFSLSSHGAAKEFLQGLGESDWRSLGIFPSVGRISVSVCAVFRGFGLTGLTGFTFQATAPAYLLRAGQAQSVDNSILDARKPTSQPAGVNRRRIVAAGGDYEQSPTQIGSFLSGLDDLESEHHLVGEGRGPRAQNLARKADLPNIRFHHLRHSAASLMLAQRIPLRFIQEVLGHSSITLTANLYARVGEQLRREAADAMDAILSR